MNCLKEKCEFYFESDNRYYEFCRLNRNYIVNECEAKEKLKEKIKNKTKEQIMKEEVFVGIIEAIELFFKEKDKVEEILKPLFDYPILKLNYTFIETLIKTLTTGMNLPSSNDIIEWWIFEKGTEIELNNETFILSTSKDLYNFLILYSKEES